MCVCIESTVKATLGLAFLPILNQFFHSFLFCNHFMPQVRVGLDLEPVPETLGTRTYQEQDAILIG